MSVIQSTQVRIDSITLKSPYASNIPLTSHFQELNLYDNIFSPCRTASLVVADSVGLMNKLVLNGSETIEIKISKDENYNTEEYKFRIYSVSHRESVNQTSEVFVINLISEEYILSLQKKLNRSFSGITHTQMVALILTEYLGVSSSELGDNRLKKIGIFTESRGNKKEIIPNLNPIDAIQWIAKRSVNKYSMPNYLFFENTFGYNFADLTSLRNLPTVRNINEEVKNISDSAESMSQEIRGLRKLKINSQFNIIDTIESGIYAGTFLGLDPVTKSYKKITSDFLDTYKTSLKGFQGIPNIPMIQDDERKYVMENFNSRITMYPSELERGRSKYITTRIGQQEDNDSTIRYNSEDVILQREGLFKMFLNKKITGAIPGDFRISSGLNIGLYGQKRTVVDGDNNIDTTKYGKYTVISSRQIISINKHETIFEAATDDMTSKLGDFKSGEEGTKQLSGIFSTGGMMI